MATKQDIDALLKEQDDIGKAFDKWNTNIQKLETAKRVKDVYEKKIEESSEAWEKFETNHGILEFSGNIEPTHQYFGKNYRNIVLSCKQQLDTYCTNAIIDLNNPHSGGGNSSSSSMLMTNLDIHLTALERSIKACSKYNPRDIGPTSATAMIKQMENDMAVITQMHTHLLMNDNTYRAGDYVRVQEKLIHVIQCINSATTQSSAHQTYTSRMSDTMKLPKISLPKFDGDYLKWLNFKELFTEMIGNTNISGTQKLMYLKQNVTGEAATLLQHLQVSEANFGIAWTALQNRYHNPRLIIAALFDKIVTMENIKTESAVGLRKMHDTLKECSNALDSILDTTGSSPIIWREIIFHHLAIRKLDSHSHALYEQGITNSHEAQQLPKLLEFLEKRFQALEAIYGKGTKVNPPAASNQHGKNEKKQSTSLLASIDKKGSDTANCECKDKHLLYKCPKFVVLSPKDRYSLVKTMKRCINCLKGGHSAKECKSRKCATCEKKHNTMLHFESKTALFGSAVGNKGFEHVFLATAIIEVLDKHGAPIKIRALLDSGSQLNIMTEKAQRKIGLKLSATSMRINGLGTAGVQSNKRAVINLKSLHSNFTAPLEVFIVNNMTTCQPASLINTKGWKIPDKISLADPQFNVPASVDLIIGGEIFYKLLSIGSINIGKNLPDLQNTVFGWVVIGKLLGLNTKEAFSGIITNQMLNSDLTKFWEIEERYQPVKSMTDAELDCEKYFLDTTNRETKTGKFIVKLQFTKEPSILGNSEDMAIRRFLYLEKRFAKDIEMKAEYVKFMDDYETLGHMEEVPKQYVPDMNYIIPHHFVRNPGSSTTKFRVVFDASAKTTTNISLNEILANGPMLQDDLFSIMVRFRKHEYVFSADIGKMYRQVLVAPEDQRWQMIVWRKDPKQSLKYYKLKTLTYGTTCASYLSIKALQQLADEHEETFPLASKIAKRDFNVDDIMTGTDDINEAVQLQQQLIEMLKLAGMDLHKWCSNHPMLLENIPEKKHDVSLDINGEKTETKALGMRWIPRTDLFMLHYTQREHKKVTKRTVLSDTAQLFDPLGLVSPVIVMAKIFLQELWTLKLDWDEPLPMELHSKWLNFKKQLLQLNDVSVPRHIIIPEATDIQLHAFSDASTRAYGAVFYIRSENQQGEVRVTQICSKSRVAPVSVTTLPRLELCGAVIMSDMVEKLQKILELEFSKVVYWTDSEVVLSWIFSNGTYKTFVANRVASINRKTISSKWRYINTKVNPADLISRGVTPEVLLQSDLWWHGPPFLKLNEEEWPLIKPAFVREISEERIVKTILLAEKDDNFISRINHRNSIKTLQRVVAYCKRVLPKHRNLGSSSLSVEELKGAMDDIIKYCQGSSFSEDITFVKKQQPEKSQFSSLSPFMDTDGILRVGGRLDASNIHYDQKHPALMPKDSEITKLIMERLHLENHHAGAQALLAITRQNYWPINGKRVAQAIVKNCVICSRSKPHLMEQIMGKLPAERVTIDRPYITVAVDFAGPVTIYHKLRGKRPTKTYICIFVCFVTKAVHMEVATDLTTAAFINCLKRFISRRGRPNKIFSDNATNFKGANNQLLELADLIKSKNHQDQVVKYCEDHFIEWKFTPPRSPHFAGLVEAAVKSAKLHLVKILHNMEFSYDELVTALAEIEAILNSRPLTPMSNNPDDLQPLTAGHFLIGMPMNGIDDGELPQRSALKMWNKIKEVRNTFWDRWSKEYLAELQGKHKWTKDRQNIELGSLVIMREDNIPPLKWQMARVIATATDNVGKVRVVELQTKNGIKKRSIHQISPLPLPAHVDEAEEIQKYGNRAIRENKTPSKLYASAKTFVPRKARLQSNPQNYTSDIPGRNVRSGVLPNKLGAIPKNSNYKNTQKPVNKSKTKLGWNPCEQVTAKKHRSGVPDNNAISWNSRLRPRTSKTHMAIMILAFFTLIFGTLAEEPCPVTTFKHNPGLYYEDMGQVSITNDAWEIKCYLNMESYWSEEESIRLILSQLQKICPDCHPMEYCKSTILQLDHQMATLQMKNELIHGFSSDKIRERQHYGIKNLSRKRRGWFNGFGVAGKEMFGLLNENDSEKFEGEIADVRVDANHMMNLIRNQTTLQEITSNIIKRDEKMTKLQFEHILHEIENLTKKDDLGKMSVFTSLSLQAMTLMSNYREMQGAILGILSQLHHGKVPAILISPAQMRKQLFVVTSHISHNLMIPGDGQPSDLAKLYNLLTAKVRLTSKNLLIVMKVPLLNREYYKLYHILPVPFMYNNQMSSITPSVKYIGVNLRQDHYYLMSELEKTGCQQFSERQIICKQNQPLHSVHGTDTVCEMAVILHPAHVPEKCSINIIRANQTWSKLASENQYMFTMAEKTSINLICGTNVLACSLNGSGIISLDPQCTLKGGSMEISSSNSYTSSFPAVMIPSSNITTTLMERIGNQMRTTVVKNGDNNTNWSEFNLEPDSDPELQALEKGIMLQKENSHHIKTTDWNNVHHYSFIYGVVILLGIIFLYKYYIGPRLCIQIKQRRNNRRQNDVESNTPTELHDLSNIEASMHREQHEPMFSRPTPHPIHATFEAMNRI